MESRVMGTTSLHPFIYGPLECTLLHRPSVEFVPVGAPTWPPMTRDCGPATGLCALWYAPWTNEKRLQDWQSLEPFLSSHQGQ